MNGFAALALVASVLFADVQIVLKGGKVLAGVDVTREGDEYLLQLATGDVVPLPADLVEEVRLLERPKPPPPPEPGFVAGKPATLAGQPAPVGEEARAPTGMRAAEPHVLAGVAVEPPRPSDQLAAFGEPAKFQKGVFDPNWRMENDWPPDYEGNQFNPAKWSESIVDNSWEPESAFDPKADVLGAGNSTWQKGMDNSWQPTDAWAK